MKKRIASVLLVLILAIGVLPAAALASGGLGNFVRVNTYQSGLFTDVASSQWYTPYVQAGFEYGLIDGTTTSTYAPGEHLTIAEAVKLAACLHSVYTTGRADFTASVPWYRPYADYALKNGIISEDYADYNAQATRSDFAQILAKALPEEALTVKNSVEDNAIPDVPFSYTYAPAVYTLYRAGVLVGSDAQGHFLPNNDITRAEVAAIVTRMANASFRQSVTLRLDLTTTQIFEKCAPAVFFIKLFDIKGTAIKTGSGFFIDENGLAVTNFHVINGAASAVVTTADGKEYDVAGVYDYSKEKDLALIKVDGGGFPYLQTEDSGAPVTGDDVYAIGSPLGFKNTISTGIISSASRDVEGRNYIQTTAAISSGSSGGALLNRSGKVIGVTTATASGAQNINLALPIATLKDFGATKLVTLKSILPDTKYYAEHYPVPDFGAYAGAPVYQDDEFGTTYYYKVSDLSKTIEDALNGYAGLLDDNCFQFYGYAIENGQIITYYINAAYGITMTFSDVDLDGTECIRVQIF
ncbi:S-layer homology domain-containing protein [Sporobacter termitidis DSM 10068]|uniref:S-layer homology domain-containing protein n=1 Tax=Sporobacter termitidis DSM 10068 TaxID=1123282 RepID=A0A1M5WTQ2_9FIRM|nr:trypsin-like peptidase domain-containing protein [Sporobacter termitidis]SHH90939.1 S-layer homology domain-containing protein [Sporobacter termitidis DSM 10068]